MSEESEFIAGTLAELNIAHAKKQPELLDFLTEDTPVLNKIKFEVATHGMWNVYEKLNQIHGAGFVDMNAKLAKMGLDTKLEKVDLSIIGGELFVAEDTAANFKGGADGYFASKTPILLKDAGQTTERKLIYDNLLRFALENGKAVSAGGANDNCYSMIAFRQIAGQNCGLYNPKAFKNGAGLDVTKIYNGGLYHNEDGVLGYGLRFKGYYGFQLANPEGVSAIVNIKKGSIPTEEQIDDMLDDVRAKPNDTIICCHPKVLSFLNKYKGNILQANANDNNMNRGFLAWNNIPFVTSRNFLKGGEKTINLSA